MQADVGVCLVRSSFVDNLCWPPVPYLWMWSNEDPWLSANGRGMIRQTTYATSAESLSIVRDLKQTFHDTFFLTIPWTEFHLTPSSKSSTDLYYLGHF